MIHTIENDYLRVSVDDHGAELCSIFDKVHNREVIWQADPAYWKRHAPVLFPNVGRNYKDIWRLNGKEYPSKPARLCKRQRILSARISPILPFPLSLSPLKKP